MSAARRKKLKRFVLDTNVWISYAIKALEALHSEEKIISLQEAMKLLSVLQCFIAYWLLVKII
jgi:hypothetical protein